MSWSTTSLIQRMKALIMPAIQNIWAIEEQDFYEDLICMGYTPAEATARVEAGRLRIQTIEELARKRREIKAERAMQDMVVVDRLVQQMDAAGHGHSNGHTHKDPRVLTEGCEACRTRKWRESHKKHLNAAPKVTYDSTCLVCTGKLLADDPKELLAALERKKAVGERLTRADKRKLRRIKKAEHKAMKREHDAQHQVIVKPPPEPVRPPIITRAIDVTPRITEDELTAALMLLRAVENEVFAAKAATVVHEWVTDRLRIMRLMRELEAEPANPPRAPVMLPPAKTSTTPGLNAGAGTTTAGAIDDGPREAGHPDSCVCQGCVWFEREYNKAEANRDDYTVRQRLTLKVKLKAIKRGDAAFVAGGLVYYSKDINRDDRPVLFTCQDKAQPHDWVALLQDKVICPICEHKPGTWVAKPADLSSDLAKEFIRKNLAV